MMAKVAFEGRPDVRIVGKPVNPYQVCTYQYIPVAVRCLQFFHLKMQGKYIALWPPIAPSYSDVGKFYLIIECLIS